MTATFNAHCDRVAAFVHLVRSTPLLATRLENALTHAGSSDTLDDVLNQVCMGTLIPLVHKTSALLCSVFPEELVHVRLAAGDLADIMHLESTALPDLARQVRAPQITLLGRRGWTKALRSAGWRETAVHMTKRVDHELWQHSGSRRRDL